MKTEFFCLPNLSYITIGRNNTDMSTHRYDANWTATYFNQYGEKEWARWDKDPEERIKLHIHQYYLKKYLKPNERILEIGAGSGRFTKTISEIGSRIIVADISKEQLKENKQNAIRYNFSNGIDDWIQIDACDLGKLYGQRFDAIVAYGGLLGYVFENRYTAIKEMIKVLKEDGLLLLSVMSTWGSLHSNLESVLSITEEENDLTIETGDLHPETFKSVHHRAHMFRANELRQFLVENGLDILEISASNCLTAGYGDRLIQIEKQDRKWKYLLEKEIVASQESGVLDIGTHIIAITKKRKST